MKRKRKKAEETRERDRGMLTTKRVPLVQKDWPNAVS